MDAEDHEPAITITPIPGEKMTVHSTGYGPGLAWTSHLRVGRREVSDWYSSPSRSLRESDEATVTRRVTLLGRECFEVRVKERKAGQTDWSEQSFEYFWIDDDGTHWIRPKGGVGGTPDLADDSAWELQDEDEGVEESEVSTECPEEGSVVEVVDLRIGERTFRCLRDTFFDEYCDERILYGGDAFMRRDGTTVYYRRLISEDHSEYPGLEGAPEYELGGKRFRVWESVVLVEEEG